MIPQLFNNTSIPVAVEAAEFAQARHNILAGNIANLDTPGYKTRDLSVETFQERLRAAIDAQHGGYVSQADGAVRYGDDAMRHVRDSIKSILYHDDSNVGMEQQINEISKNQILHNLAIAIMNSQFQVLEAAISERI